MKTAPLQMNTKNIIALDLGATKCAAGIIEYNHHQNDFHCKNICEVKLADTHSLEEMLLKIAGMIDMPFHEADAVCIGAAGQYDGQVLQHLPGVYKYKMNFAEIAARQKWRRHAVIHDYDTIVCATFTSYMQRSENVLYLNDQSPDKHQRRVALGLGSGLGLKDGVLLPNGDFWLGKNEIGHIGMITPPSASNIRLSQHQEFHRFITLQHDKHEISLECILTGRGLKNLYQFLYPEKDDLSPEMIGNNLQTGALPELADLFAWYLGLFIGSVQLIFMPNGGIWITGGVAIKHLEIFSQQSFYEGVNASPAFKREREAYPLGVLKNPVHALVGAGFYAVKRLGLVDKSFCDAKVSTDPS